MSAAPTSRWCGLLAAGIALSSGVAGCVSSQSSRLEYRLETSRKESEPSLLVAKGEAYARAGDYGRAAQYLRAALLQHGDANLILPLLVSVEIKDQSYRAAVQHLEDRLRTHPSDVHARFVLGSLMAALDRPKQAERELVRLLERAPRHAEATFALGIVYRDGLGDHQRADDCFRRYLALEPDGRHREEATNSTLKSTEPEAQ
ncbi:MAG TPA: tetratricopeptide repeat protein [Polyangiaceae bacterium]|nr:tetratricopeptide repeat protein [Polyangiaceae bacterium]